MIETSQDRVIQEIHQTREEISDRFSGDIEAITDDAARRQAGSNRPVWRPSASAAVEPREKPRSDRHET